MILYIYYYSTNPNVSSNARLLMCTEPTEQKLSAVFMGVSSWGFGGTNVGGQNGGKLWGDVGAEVSEIWCCAEIWVLLQLDGHVSLRLLRCCKKLRSTCIVMVEWTRWEFVYLTVVMFCDHIQLARRSGIAGEPFFFSGLFHWIYSFKDVFQWSHWLFLLVLSGFEIPLFPTVLVGILQCRLSQLVFRWQEIRLPPEPTPQELRPRSGS